MSGHSRSCGVCSGRGKLQCAMCGGTGSRTQTAYYDGRPYPESVSCSSCSGGYRFCECCSGTGRVSTSETSSDNEEVNDDEPDADVPAGPTSTAELSALHDEAIRDAYQAQQEVLQDLENKRPQVRDLARYHKLVQWVQDLDPVAPGTAKALAGIVQELNEAEESDLALSFQIFESACSRIENYAWILKNRKAGH